MKRIVSFVVAIILMCACTSAFADPWRVFDNVGLFSDEEIETLEASILDFQKETGMDFVIVNTNDYVSKSKNTFPTFFWNDGGFGFGKGASGVICYTDMNKSALCIDSYGEAVDIITDDIIYEMISESISHINLNEDFAAAQYQIEHCKSLLLEE